MKEEIKELLVIAKDTACILSHWLDDTEVKFPADVVQGMNICVVKLERASAQLESRIASDK